MSDTEILVGTKEEKVKSLGVGGARQRFYENIISNLVLFVTQVFVNFWITPYLIGQLGIAAYGMIPLTQTIISYGTVLTTSLNASLGRFLTIDIEKQDGVSANKTFNTSLFFLVFIIGVLTPIFIIISVLFPRLFNVPTGWELDSSWLSATVALTLFIGVLTTNFSVSPFIYSKFLLSNSINFVGIVIRTGLMVLLFVIYPPHLWYFGVGNVISALVVLIWFIFVWKNLTPGLHIRINAFDRPRLYSLVGMGGWLTVNTLGAMLLNRVDLIAVNIFFGAAILGGYAAVAQFATFLDTLINTITTILRPILFIKYAQQDYIGLQKVTNQAIKLLGIFLALVVGLLCGFSKPLIAIWLGPSYKYLSLLLIVITAHYSINLAVRPLVYVQQAYNRVRWPGIVTLLFGIGNLAIDISIGLIGKWDVMAIAITTPVIWTLRNSVYNTIYTARIMKVPWWTFFSGLKTTAVATIIVGLTAYGLTVVRMPNSWLTLALFGLLISVPYCVIVWLFVLNLSERQLLFNLLPIKIPKSLHALLKV